MVTFFKGLFRGIKPMEGGFVTVFQIIKDDEVLLVEVPGVWRKEEGSEPNPALQGLDNED